MAYGNNKDRKDWVIKAVPLAIGKATAQKQAELALLYDAVLALMQKMALDCFIQEPLAPDFKSYPLEQRLIALQKADDTLNQVWAEQARMRVKPALDEAYKRYVKRLAGGLRYVDSKIDYPEAPPEPPQDFVGPLPLLRRYVNVPADIQDAVTHDEFAALKALGESKGAIDMVRRVILDKNASGLTPHQIAIIQDIHARAQAKHNPPVFGAGSRFTLQLTLDYRMLPIAKGVKVNEALQLRQGEAYLLKDDKNKVYRRFIDLAGVRPRAPRLRIPVSINKTLSRRLDSTKDDYAALTLELSRDETAHLKVGMRIVCGKPKPELSPKTNAIHFAVGRDFGYKNTICLSLIQSETPIDLGSDIPVLAIRSRNEAKVLLETLQRPDDIKVVQRLQFSGEQFLAVINRHCDIIERYTSRIDRAYNTLMATKGRIVKLLELGEEELISKAQVKTKAREDVIVFMNTLDQIQSLKKARRQRYQKIAALKKSWFGYLSNQEVALAKAYNAIIVREDLTVVAMEKDKPDYKGRRFNKLINNGSKGQYQNQASDKFAWNGIPELVIGSWYTSRLCSRHGVIVNKARRSGEKLFLPCCQRHDHADLHASETIATIPFLKPKTHTRPLAVRIVTPAGSSVL